VHRLVEVAFAPAVAHGWFIEEASALNARYFGGAARDWLLISVESDVLSWWKSMLAPIIASMSSTMPAENIHMIRISRFSLSGS